MVKSIAAIAILIAFPFFASNYLLHIFATICIWVLLIGGVNFLSAAGYASLCQAAFYGIGAYTAVLMGLRANTPFWCNLLAGFVLAGGSGALVGLPAIRARGHYFIIITMCFGVIMTNVFINWETLTKGDHGIITSTPSFLSGFAYFYLLAGIAVLFTFISYKLLNSRFGRQLVAIKEDEDLALQLGINADRVKLYAFVLGAAFAGLAGGLMAHYVAYVHPNFYSLDYSFIVLIGSLVGGAGTTLGGILGTGVAVGLPEALRFTGGARYIALGIVFLLVITLMPRGLSSVLNYLTKVFYKKP